MATIDQEPTGEGAQAFTAPYPQASQNSAPPPQYASANSFLPPSYSESVSGDIPTITQQFTMPALNEVDTTGQTVVMMMPKEQQPGVWMWVPMSFADPEAAKREAIMRLMYTQGFFVDEQIQWLEAHKGCMKRENMFLIFDSATGVPLFLAEEETEECDRCCCQPGNSKKVNIFIVDCYTRPNRAVGPIWSMTREGATCLCGESKCTKCPSCIGCCGMFNCMDCTRDEYKLYQGYADKFPHEEQTVPEIGRMRQQGCCSEGWCGNPTLSLYKTGVEDPYAVVEAPKLFGGWLGVCCDSDVYVSRTDSLLNEGTQKGCGKYPLMTGDLAKMRKLRPDGCCDCLNEMCTDADRYSLDFTSPTLSVEQRVSILGSLVAMDTALWESDVKPVYCSREGIMCTLFECYLCGCICPCCLYMPRKFSG